MIKSMTGFASGKGAFGPNHWSWELRSVNGRGLDMRLRVPDGLTGLEAALRGELSKQVNRGNVTLSLQLNRKDIASEIHLNVPAMEAALDALAQSEAMAGAHGIALAPSKACDLLALKGVLEAGSENDDPTPLVEQLKTEFAGLLAAFNEMRCSEGQALVEILSGQLDQIAQLTDKAVELAQQRREEMAQTLKENLARVVDNTQGVDAERVAQELALIAAKADITEEIDRLAVHIDAARVLLVQDGPIGRKLDFLMQEFNREANTLCSKSQNTELTMVGLELKAVIDQMREQVRNVE